MFIATQLLIASLNTTPAMTGVGDLCDVVDRRTGTPTICEPHKEGAPVYNANVCCAGSTCFPTSAGGCSSGESLYYCGLGEQTSTGTVSCYFEVPDYCNVYSCGTGVAPYPWEGGICCQYDYCLEITPYSAPCPPEDIYYCSSLVSNADGSVTCVDNE
jgi:hypothetical protein